MAHYPLRTCVGCRSVTPANVLVCLIAPEGKVTLAQRGRGQAADERPRRGRGTWVHPACLAVALKSGALGRAFRARVEVVDREALLAAAHVALRRSSDVQGIHDDGKRL